MPRKYMRVSLTDQPVPFAKNVDNFRVEGTNRVILLVYSQGTFPNGHLKLLVEVNAVEMQNDEFKTIAVFNDFAKSKILEHVSKIGVHNSFYMTCYLKGIVRTGDGSNSYTYPCIDTIRCGNEDLQPTIDFLDDSAGDKLWAELQKV